MNSENPTTMLSLDNYSIGIGMTDEQKPACLILSYDALEDGGDIAIKATTAQLVGNDFHLVSDSGTLILSNVGQAIKDAAGLHLPVVVIDPEREREILVERWLS
jgi:hypothetical protein